MGAGTASTDDDREVARLAAVRASRLFVAQPDPTLDAAAHVVRHLLRAPVGLVSIVGDTQQVFRGASAAGGAEAIPRQTPIDASFCRIVVDEGPLIVVDARVHDRFADHPAVALSGAVAYLGVPLRDQDDVPLGAVCAIDLHPHEWDDDDLAGLTALAEVVGRDLAARSLDRVAHEQQALLTDTRTLLAHDLRNALQTIALAATILPAVPGLPDRAARLSAAITHRSEQANALLDEVLASSSTPTTSSPDLARTLRDVIEAEVAHYPDVEVDVDVDAALESGSRALVTDDLLGRSVAGLVRAAARRGAGSLAVRATVVHDGLELTVSRRGAADLGSGADDLGPAVASLTVAATHGALADEGEVQRLLVPLAGPASAA